MPLIRREVFYFEKRQNLNFWWYLKIPQTNCLWQNLAVLGRSFAMVVANNMPSFEREKIKCCNS
jgi:hypothetical protein